MAIRALQYASGARLTHSFAFENNAGKIGFYCSGYCGCHAGKESVYKEHNVDKVELNKDGIAEKWHDKEGYGLL